MQKKKKESLQKKKKKKKKKNMWKKNLSSKRAHTRKTTKWVLKQKTKVSRESKRGGRGNAINQKKKKKTFDQVPHWSNTKFILRNWVFSWGNQKDKRARTLFQTQAKNHGGKKKTD